MSACLGCGLHANERGQLDLDLACTMNDLLTCVTGIQNAPDGQTQGLGSTQQWPKRFSTQVRNDPNNDGYHTADLDGDGEEDGDPASDDQVFIGSSVRGNVDDFTVPCPTSIPSAGSDFNVTIASSELEFTNTFDIPVIVQVQTAAWHGSMTVPQADAPGGARWIGDARVGISGDNGTTYENMVWQRAWEMAAEVRANPDYQADQAGIEAAAAAAGDTVASILEQLSTCLKDGVADAIENMRCQAGTDQPVINGDARDLLNCLVQFDNTVTLLRDRFDSFGAAILNADLPAPCNPAYLDRYIQTGGAWQHEIVVQPGQTIRAQTRARFARWSNGACQTPHGDWCACRASGVGRAGRIDFTVHPIFGGRNCGSRRYSLGAWYGVDTVDLGLGTFGN